MTRLREKAQLFPIAIAPVALLFFSTSYPPERNSAAAAPTGERIYGDSCASCHSNGKNLVEPKKPVIGSKKLSSKEAFKALLSKASGNMPAFPKIAGDDQALSALYDYVRTLK